MTALTHKQKLIRLTLRGNPDGGSEGTRNAVFEFSVGDDQTPKTVTEELRTETRTFGGTPLTIFGDILGDAPGVDEEITENKAIALDFGEAQFAPQIQGVITADQTHPDGTPYQWGDKGDDSTLTQTDATGAHPAKKSAVFSYWLRNTRTSSVSNILGDGGGGPAELEYMEYRSDDASLYSPLRVVFENPSITYSGGSPGVADISMTCVEVATLDQPLDAVANDGR